ncbi:predicted protein [Sclerotinia sclerotiorum 1980 UF-70]|uniref:Uncharacterized protein n=1 Tax=Sclerotinia sclerotiorum (strain ATCC 18683 / 1980 / Ss-1) TaxID=665079 RepID=A7EHC8_SCLS1|nr:predicted protein [Sclerotinia sclerotiorum 1980 UF-70]EDO02244.1 predicted protein [Sclerotinia sclerotiorum 1980 UF-70]
MPFYAATFCSQKDYSQNILDKSLLPRPIFGIQAQHQESGSRSRQRLSTPDPNQPSTTCAHTPNHELD